MYKTSSGTYNVTPTDYKLNFNCAAGDVICQLPSYKGRGALVITKTEASAYTVTVTPLTGQTIEGSATVILTKKDDFLTLYGTESGWEIVDQIDNAITPTSIAIGTMATPITLATNPGATYCAETINLLHSAGAGDCDDLLAAYQKVVVSGDGDAGITIVGNAPRAYVGTVGGTTVAAQAYASQPWANHKGTGAITANAIKVTGALATNFMEISAASTGVVVAAGTNIHHDPNAVTSDAYLIVKIGSVQYALPLYVLNA